MARRVTPSQFRSKLRQLQAKRKQAIDKYNRDVTAYNQKLRSAVNKHNQAVNRYNSQVRAHNNRVRANRNRLRQELDKLVRAASQPRYVTFRRSVESVHRSYFRLESAAETSRYGDHYNDVLDLSEREAANSASVMNALLGNPESLDTEAHIQSTTLDPVLSLIAADLPDRWHGALFSLNPNNPDAARHFCTSAREILTRILDSRAPDRLVLAEMPACERTASGSPTRRAKIRFFLQRSNMSDEALENFVEEDIRNVLHLFREFNDGTHGSAGRFSLKQLLAIKKRVEDAVAFLWSIIPEELRNLR
ncbi:MAG: hypothetical protein OXU81_13245 [Gammaproteobacteria bacterium]|nr:hypothetical protein [Gammaproteobacteria bacterium]